MGDLVDKTNALLADPSSAPLQRAVKDATKKMDDDVDRLLQELFPDKLVMMPSFQYDGKVDPDDLIAQGAKVKAADAAVFKVLMDRLVRI